ncbi:cell adhesion molecule CEACAM6-like [Nelusetta ayraudi]|uniref:cell adhesion molecule CEACAM6-like n=1 Tax=Nelusetta ayraudi TaxID=303726 RepID=UPI003F700F77
MEKLLLLYLSSVAFTGLCEGAGVLPAGPLNVSVGGTIVFTTTLSPDVSIQYVDWRFNENNYITYSNETGNFTEPAYEGRISLMPSTGSLELRNVTFNDAGPYQVLIEPKNERVLTGGTRLQVYAPISDAVLNASRIEMLEFSGPVNLSISSTGSSRSFNWQNNSQSVLTNERVRITEDGAVLTVLNVTRYDQGPFSCLVNNPVSNTRTNEVTLFISYGPENVTLTTPSQEYYAAGSTVNMSCLADSRPATYFWFVDGNQLSDSGPELQLVDIQLNQDGNYSCQVFNNQTLRNETTQPVAVRVLERISQVSITASPANQLLEGSMINLTCEASGSIFTRRWRKDGAELSVDENMALHELDSVLSFRSMNTTYEGNYSCAVGNPVGMEEASYVLKIQWPSHSSCSAGCIAGIVIACVVVVVAAACVTFCLCKKRQRQKTSSATIADNSKYSEREGQDNAAFSSSQGKMELQYSEISFQANNRSGPPAWRAPAPNQTNYAEVVVDGSSAPSSSPSPPSYAETLKRKQEALQSMHYAQHRKK